MKVKKLLDIAAGKKLPMLACNEYLAKVGLCSASYLTREVDKNLSGGEVKRIEIATILARDPKLAIYDEPEAGIDLWSFDRLTETFRDIHEARDGRSIVIISHQERIIQLADEIVLLRNGKVAETGTPEELMPKLGFVAKGIPGCQLSTPPSCTSRRSPPPANPPTPRCGMFHVKHSFAFTHAAAARSRRSEPEGGHHGC